MTFKIALCGSACLFALASTASAQQLADNSANLRFATDVVVQTGPINSPPPSAKPANTPQTYQTVTVTGTRIVRNGYSAPTPVTVAPVAELELTTPSDIADALNKLPQFSNSYTQTTLANNSASLPPGNFINLRDLSTNTAERTLILMNGERVPPTTQYGQVDANTLPQMLVQRVDVVTGGASAVYGSDAVAGVVNFVLDTKYNGLKMVAQTGISTYGDMPSQRLGLAAGGPLLANGHYIFSVEHYSEASIDQADRSFSANTPSFTGLGTAASPFTLTYNNRFAASSNGGYISKGPASIVGSQFANNGASLVPFTAGTATGTNGVQSGGSGGYFAGASMVRPQDTDQAFGRYDYDFGHEISGFAQVSFAQSQAQYRAGNYVFGGTSPSETIYSDNPYLPTAVAAAMPAGSSISVGQLPLQLEQLSTTDETTRSFAATVGLNGKVLSDNFSWDAYYAYGQASTRSVTTNNINSANFFAALDAVAGPNGTPVCRVSTTANASLYPGCAPLNMLGVGNQSSAALTYVLQNTAWETVNTTNDFSASISGSAFSDWAGPVSLASNVEYRTQGLNGTGIAANTPPLTGLTHTGLSLAQMGALQPYLYATTAPQSGFDSVWEVSGETVVPLAKDLPLVENLEVNAAVRYTDYSTSGPAVTWKIGLNYQPIEDLRFRATESRDIRAPDLYDLDAGATAVQGMFNDLIHSGQQSIATQITTGNPNLVPEVAFTRTVGLVYSPSWFRPFRISVDYFDIGIADAIGSDSAYINLACQNSNGTSPYCADIIRPASGSLTGFNSPLFPTEIIQEAANLTSLHTSGIDVEASYAIPLANLSASLPGQVSIRALYEHQPQYTQVAYPGAVAFNSAGLTAAGGFPIDRATVMFNYGVGPFSASWEARYSGVESHSGGAQNPTAIYASPAYPMVIYDDLGLTYRFKTDGHNLQTFLTIDNIFNQQPRITGDSAAQPGFGAPAFNGDDAIGRYFTGGVRVSF